MNWYVTFQYAAPYYSVSDMGSKFGAHLYFVVCLGLVCIVVTGYMLFYEVVGSKILQVL